MIFCVTYAQKSSNFWRNSQNCYVQSHQKANKRKQIGSSFENDSDVNDDDGNALNEVVFKTQFKFISVLLVNVEFF